MAVADNAEKARTVRRARRLGRYELIARIGHGGMAEVYLARQKGPMNFEKVVVVKAIHPHLSREERFIHMLLDEARIAALIKHPRVVDIYDLGEADGTYFIAMEHLVGQSMAKIIKAARKGDPLDVLSTVQIIADSADGLHAAHSLKDNKGKHLELVHRDVTPGNIIVTYDGGVKLLDFGVSSAKGRLTQTQAGKVKGKMGYTAPEQIIGEGIDRRSDVFSLGVVLWESLALGRLFKAANARQAMDMIKSWRAVPPSAYRKGVPKEVDEICLRALKTDKEQRFQSALEMRNALLGVLREANYNRDAGTLEGHMQRVFGKQREEQEELIRRVSEADSEIDVGGVVSNELDPGDSLPVARPQAKSAPAAPKAPPLPPHLRRRRESVAPLADEKSAASPAEANASPAPEASGEGAAPAPAPVDETGDLGSELSAIHRGRWFWPSIVGAAALILLVIAFTVGDDEGQRSPELAAGADRAAAGASEEPGAESGAGSEGGEGDGTASASAEDGAEIETETENETETELETETETETETEAGAEEAAPAGAESPPEEEPDEPPETERRGEKEAAAVAPRPDPAPDPAPKRDEEDEQRKASEDRGETREAPGGAGTAGEAKEDERGGPDEASGARRGGARARARARSYYRAGAKLMIRGQHGAARRKFRAALSAYPGYAPAYRGLGLVYEKMGNSRAAVRSLKRYLRLAPNASDAGSIRARIRRLGG